MKREIIFMYALWCKNCCLMLSNFRKVIDNNKFDAYIKAVNVEEEVNLSVKYSVRNVPTVLILENGKEINRIKGFLSEKEMVKEFKKWSK